MGLLDELDSLILEIEFKQRDSFLKETDAYKQELKNIYEAWVEDYLADLEGVSKDERPEYIAAALLLLGQQLKARQRIKLLEAFSLGLAGDPPSPYALQQLANHIAEQEKYVDSSLLPDLGTYFLEHLEDEDYEERLLTRVARIGLYAGAFWAALQGAQYWLSPGDRKVTWVTQRDQEVCPDCIALGKGNWTISTLPTTPSMGDTRCLSNCRCYLLFSDPLELWPYQGNP